MQKQFSDRLKSRNLLHLKSERGGEPGRSTRVGFVLFDHFSLAAFTGALDVLVTANLLLEGAPYKVHTFGVASPEVPSDLHIQIKADDLLFRQGVERLDLLVLCGGFRTSLTLPEGLARILVDAAREGVALAGLWNGAHFLAKAGLLHGYRCAIHPENRAGLLESSPDTGVVDDHHVLDRERMTAASPNGATAMMLDWIRGRHGDALVQGIEEILAVDGLRFRRSRPDARRKTLSEPLRNLIALMENNLEDPLSLDDLAGYVARSRRQIDRLFRQELGTSPHRYYLELRITEARRLLQQSSLPILQIAVACGFASTNHFSKCYRAYFGHPPSQELR